MFEWSIRLSRVLARGPHVPRWYTAETPKSSAALTVKTTEAVRTEPGSDSTMRTSPPMTATGNMSRCNHPRSRGLTTATRSATAVPSAPPPAPAEEPPGSALWGSVLSWFMQASITYDTVGYGTVGSFCVAPARPAWAAGPTPLGTLRAHAQYTLGTVSGRLSPHRPTPPWRARVWAVRWVRRPARVALVARAAARGVPTRRGPLWGGAAWSTGHTSAESSRTCPGTRSHG